MSADGSGLVFLRLFFASLSELGWSVADEGWFEAAVHFLLRLGGMDVSKVT